MLHLWLGIIWYGARTYLSPLFAIWLSNRSKPFIKRLSFLKKNLCAFANCAWRPRGRNHFTFRTPHVGICGDVQTSPVTTSTDISLSLYTDADCRDHCGSKRGLKPDTVSPPALLLISKAAQTILGTSPSHQFYNQLVDFYRNSDWEGVEHTG